MYNAQLPLSAAAKFANFQRTKKDCKPGFYGWVLSAMKNRSQKNTNQLWYESLLQEWRGLSGRGMQVKGKQSQQLTSRTYRRHKDKALEQQARELRVTLATGCCYFWIDNFSNYLKKSLGGVMPAGPYMTFNWTPLAISKLPGTQLQQLAHVHQGDGSILAAHPKRVLSKIVIKGIMTYVQEFDNYSVETLRYWETSIGTVHSVFNTPLRMVRPHTQAELHFGTDTGLKNFQPVDLLTASCQTREGLCAVLRILRADYWIPGHYMLLKVDIDLYWKMAKVT